MKKTFLIFAILAFLSQIFANAQKVDPVLTAEQISALKAALPKAPAVKRDAPANALMFSRTCGYRHHAGIVYAREVFTAMGEALGIWTVDSTEDPLAFEEENLKKYDFVILNNSTGMCFGESAKTLKEMSESEKLKVKERSDRLLGNLMRFVEEGGGVFAVHGGIDAYGESDFKNVKFIEMLGGNFESHPWYITNAPSTIFIEDENSPVTQGIWNANAFKITEEIYQFGEHYDRSSLRVLIRLDVDKSPVTTESGLKLKIRDDKDIPLVWIKNFSKGRVAYGGFGHDGRNYYNPKIQELYMRLAQFVSGDLKADTVSQKLSPANSVRIPMYDIPSKEKITSLRTLKYGERIDEINEINFAICENNTDQKFCEYIQDIIETELKIRVGTPAYRTYLARFLTSSNLKDPVRIARFEGLMKAEGNESVRCRLDEAVSQAKNLSGKNEEQKSLEIPKELPSSHKEQIAIINFLTQNPQIEIPQYLKLNFISKRAIPQAIYLFAKREKKDALKDFEPQTEDELLAYSFAVGKLSITNGVEKVLDKADLLKSKTSREIAASFLLASKSGNVIDTFLKLSSKKLRREAQDFIDTALALSDLSKIEDEVYKNYSTMSEAERSRAFFLASCIASDKMFDQTFKIMLSEKKTKLAMRARRTLVLCATNNIDPQSMKMVAAAYLENPEKFKGEMLDCICKIATISASPEAFELCNAIYEKGFKEKSFEMLGRWRNGDAYAALMKYAESASDAREKTLAQIEIINLAQRVRMNKEPLEYMILNAVRDEDFERAIDLGRKRASIKPVLDKYQTQIDARLKNIADKNK